MQRLELRIAREFLKAREYSKRSVSKTGTSPEERTIDPLLLELLRIIKNA